MFGMSSRFHSADFRRPEIREDESNGGKNSRIIILISFVRLQTFERIFFLSYARFFFENMEISSFCFLYSLENLNCSMLMDFLQRTEDFQREIGEILIVIVEYITKSKAMFARKKHIQLDTQEAKGKYDLFRSL